MDARADVQAEVQERLHLERLLAGISERLTDLASADFLSDVEASLRQIVEFLGYDRCTFSEFIAGDYLNVLCSASAGDVPVLPPGRLQTRLPWFFAQLRAGKVVALPNVPDDLPPEAVEEARHCREIGLKSHLSIPLRVGGRVTSVLSFAAMRKARQWPPDIAARLKTIGEVLASAVALARAQEEARQLRQRVWHADRVERVSALTAAIAHDLNQPLTAILSNAQAGLKYLARADATPRVIQEILDAVVREEKRAAETIRTMRALIRQDETRRERFELAGALGDVLGLLASEFVGQGVRVETRLDSSCQVLADRTQIEQLALNLLLNAAAAVHSLAPDRRVVWLEVAHAAPGRVRIAVRDAGQGIASQDLETIFEPFWTTREEGLGLGLAICRSIVESHEGRIWAESNAGGGATFHIELPEAPEDHGANGMAGGHARAARDAEAPAAGMAPVVCVIDDDDAVRDGLVRLLAHEGWRTDAFSSADEFIAHPPGEADCILLDIRMPGLSGLRLQRQLVDMGYAAPVIFLTGHGDVTAGVEAMKWGAADFLQKPVEGEVLIAAVRRAVQQHAAQRVHQLAQLEARNRLERLSVREREILDHVVRGRLNKQIAADLLISEQTVKQHRGRVMEKMGVRSVADLVRACGVAGLAGDAAEEIRPK